tara:strand:- start:221 stop:997 length:777 start_codon:yes stop_codon:yes gene_type:complete
MHRLVLNIKNVSNSNTNKIIKSAFSLGINKYQFSFSDIINYDNPLLKEKRHSYQLFVKLEGNYSDISNELQPNITNMCQNYQYLDTLFINHLQPTVIKNAHDLQKKGYLKKIGLSGSNISKIQDYISNGNGYSINEVSISEKLCVINDELLHCLPFFQKNHIKVYNDDPYCNQLLTLKGSPKEDNLSKQLQQQVDELKEFVQYRLDTTIEKYSFLYSFSHEPDIIIDIQSLNELQDLSEWIPSESHIPFDLVQKRYNF